MEEERTPARRRFAATAGVIAVTVLLVALALRVPAVHDALGHVLDGDSAALRDQLRSLGVWGAVVLVVLVLVHTVVPYPAEIALAVAGYVYGFWVGVPLMLLAWLLTGLLGYGIGRWLGRPAARRLLGAERVDRTAAMLDGAGAFPLLASRLLPVVPFTLASVVPGALRVPLGRFAWTTVVGYVPLTCTVVLLGGRLEHLSPTDPLLWAGIGLIVLLLAVARPLLRRLEHHAPAAPPAASPSPGSPAAASAAMAPRGTTGEPSRAGRRRAP